ncbi:MAG: magnesium transporter [Candidatus Omnitrophica bacterium]|nr:magnesium transporter [Candidatus Omnitrophota bacterium]
MKLFLYFSEMIGMDVLDSQGQWVAGVHDIAMNPQGDIYPKATELIVRRGFLDKEYARVAWEDLIYIEEEVRLKMSVTRMVFTKDHPRCDFTLRRDILDQQVVDTDDQRVVRVNDIHLLRVENFIYAAHVDVSLRGLVRRLGWTGPVDFLVWFFRRQSPYLTLEEFIPWKNTQVLPKLGRMKSVLKLDVAKNKLSGIPPAALADIMQDLDIFARVSLFKSFDTALQNRVFTDMPLARKEELIDQLPQQEVAALIQSIPADEATDLLMKLPRAKTHQLLRLFGLEAGKKLRKLLSFAKDSAGGLMTTEYLFLKPDATVADALAKIKDNTDFPGSIFFLYIIDDNHKYLGTTSLRRFINADPATPLLQTCYPENIHVYTQDDIEQVALLLERYKFSSIPVLNHEDILQGVITMDDVMEELIALVWSKYKEKL